jgi:heme/copper-type cytochrome/quinol oxidase subunit 2
MRKIFHVIAPVFFIMLGIMCLTMSSMVFHSHNPLHHFLESFIGICILIIVPVILVVLYLGFKKSINRTEK